MTKLREPTSVIEMAEMCRYGQSRVHLSPDVKSEDVLMARAALEAFETCDFYEIEDSVAKATDDVFENTFGGRDVGEIVIDKDCRLPSKVCAFWSPGSKVRFFGREEHFPFMYLAMEGAEESDSIYVFLVSPYFGTLHKGNYTPGTQGSVRLSGEVEFGSVENMQVHAAHVLTVAALCSILNQPSFTKSEPAGSRQERRAAKRSGSYASDAWHKITWNIGEEVKAKLTRDEPVRCMPLHYTRGHWRRAEEGWKNTTQRKDGLWYQWIEGFWSGHPAFGIKKSYHAPKMGDAA